MKNLQSVTLVRRPGKDSNQAPLNKTLQIYRRTNLLSVTPCSLLDKYQTFRKHILCFSSGNTKMEAENPAQNVSIHLLDYSAAPHSPTPLDWRPHNAACCQLFTVNRSSWN
jgi:hypothetical protein